jgi:HK97 family phage prohead protease
MMIKTTTARIKAAGPDDGLGEMQFTGYASVFGNKDSYGDVVEPGAFTDTLAKWQTSGEVIPCLWGHDMLDPESNIGHVLEASQDSRGLLVKVQLDPESDRAKTVYRLLKGRRVGDMSFAYEVQDSAWAKSDELGDYQALRKLHLFEVSVVGIGANQEAEILTVKTAAAMLADGVKAGRVISAKNESSLRAARDAIDAVLSSLGDSDSEKASGTGPDNAVKAAEDPSRNPSVDSLAAMDVLDIELSIA